MAITLPEFVKSDVSPRLAPAHMRFLVLIVAAIAALGSGVLFAQDPILRDRVTDETGVLEDIGGIENAIQDLEDDHSVQLWVLFVDTTGQFTVTDFADSVAVSNSFGGNDALLVVAIDDRSDALWVSDGLDEVTTDEIDQLLTDELEPLLGDGDFEGAVIALANGLGTAASADLPSGSQSGGSTSSGDGGGNGGTIFLLVVLGLIVVGVAIFLIRRRSRTRQVAQGKAEENDELSKQANGLLLAVDDELRDAGQELGFADAQFGEAEVKSFRDALAQARGELKDAFAARQELDDDIPDTPEQRTNLFRKIIAHCESARAILVPERERIDKLRDIERAAPELLAAMPARIEEFSARLDAAEEGFVKLQGYADAVWSGLDGNTIEAEKRLDFAREAATAGQALVEAGSRPEAGAHARAGQAGLAEANMLIEAVEHQVEAVQQAEAGLSAALAAAQAEVVAARTAVEQQRAQGGQESVARAATLLESARKAAAGTRPDPIMALKLAQEADDAADGVLAQVREAGEQQTRQESAYRAAEQRAVQASLRASDYILGRRNGIGREARTRLAEAERHLDSARSLARLDVARALAEAEAAERLAGDAYRLAQQDFDGYNRSGSNARATSTGHSQSRGGGGIDMGSVLGGVLGGILGSGMGSGPGFGGTGWGNYTGGKSRSKSSGGFKLPSAGGRSSGGSFKGSSSRGGGGRSRGGRW